MKARHWLYIEDGILPEGNGPKHVLVTAEMNNGQRYVTSKSYLPAYGRFAHCHDKVVAWQPLPEPAPKRSKP